MGAHHVNGGVWSATRGTFALDRCGEHIQFIFGLRARPATSLPVSIHSRIRTFGDRNGSGFLCDRFREESMVHSVMATIRIGDVICWSNRCRPGLRGWGHPQNVRRLTQDVDVSVKQQIVERSCAEWRKICTQIALELRQQYTVGFYSKATDNNSQRKSSCQQNGWWI